MKRIIALFLLLGFLTLHLNAQNTLHEPGVTNFIEGIKISETIHDFGKIKRYKPVTVDFVLTNNRKETLVLIDVKKSCKCTSVKYEKAPVAPGKSVTISATFNAKYPSDFQQTVYITTNFSKEPLGLKLKGEVIE